MAQRALAEAIIVATSATKKKRVLLPRTVSPAYRRVARTYTQGLPLELEEIGFDTAQGTTDIDALRQALSAGDVAAVVLAQPNFFGCLEDAQAIADAAHAAGALLISVFNPISLGILPPPGEYGADIAVADGQALGISLNFGGPGVGLFCCRLAYARFAPGRLIGLTADAEGTRGFTLTLQTREQHIRREKATSNICSNQALCALVATIFLAAIGPNGLEEYASQSFHKAHFGRQQLDTIDGVTPQFDGEFFHEFALHLPISISELNSELAQQGIIGPYDLGQDYPELTHVGLFCCTEKRSREEIELLLEAVQGVIAPHLATSNGHLSLNGHHA